MAEIFVAALTLSACSAPTAQLSVHLVTQACSAPQPFANVTHVRVLVTGDSMKTVVQTTTVNQHALAVTGIVPGKNRRLEVRGYIKDPAEGGRVFSVGRSQPFDVSGTATAKGAFVVEVPAVIMRPVNVFVKPTRTSSLGTCTGMGVARAGLSASSLGDGRVFIAGGFSTDATGLRTMLASTELFDPLTGAFTPGPDLPGPTGARAFHTASALPENRVFLAGGEQDSPDGGFTALGSAFVFHVDAGTYDAVALSSPRTQHGAGQVDGGNTLLVGGLSASGVRVDTLEWFQPESGLTRVLGQRLGVTGMAVQGFADSSGVVVAGGSDGTNTLNAAYFFPFSGGTFGQSSSLTLTSARRNGALVPFQDGSHLVLAGGFTPSSNESGVDGLGSTEILNHKGGTLGREEGPAVGPRGDVCAVVLADFQALVAGGLSVNFGAPLSDASAELLTTAKTGGPISLGMPALQRPRHAHACAALPDGSALIVGGLDDSSGIASALSDALIFMPSPRD